MRDAVRAAFVGFTAPLEGVVNFMYLDVKGLVTTAIGNLIDPVQVAMQLPFMRPDGSPATKAEIAEEWARVKARQDLKLRGGMAYKTVTALRLTPEGIDLVVSRKLSQMDQVLAMRFAGYEDFPADAQLGMLSVSWAAGPHFAFPLFCAAIKARDWVLAAQEAHLSELGNPGLAPRNRANKVLFRNAAFVAHAGHDPSVLHWPKDLYAEDDTDPQVPSMRQKGDSEPPEFHPAAPITMPPTLDGITKAMQDAHEALERKRRDE